MGHCLLAAIFYAGLGIYLDKEVAANEAKYREEARQGQTDLQAAQKASSDQLGKILARLGEIIQKPDSSTKQKQVATDNRPPATSVDRDTKGREGRYRTNRYGRDRLRSPIVLRPNDQRVLRRRVECAIIYGGVRDCCWRISDRYVVLCARQRSCGSNSGAGIKERQDRMLDNRGRAVILRACVVDCLSCPPQRSM
jgi:hypothetical protein